MPPSSSRHGQRIVILPGPHKMASSSVQKFLVELQQENKQKELLKAWSQGRSIVIGAEKLDFLAALPELQVSAAFQRLQSILPESTTNTIPEAAIMYRTPRASHLVSIWKQQVSMAERGNVGPPWRFKLKNAPTPHKKDAPYFSEWLCNGHIYGYNGIGFNIQGMVASQANPMGIASAFVEYGHFNVTIADMSGTDDLPSTVACEILGVPCTTNHKVIGYENEEMLTLAKRENPTLLGFSDEEMSQVEDVLRRMDCYYYCQLRGNISILHGVDEMFTTDNGWNGCCNEPAKWKSPAQAYEALRHLGCRAPDGTTTSNENDSTPHIHNSKSVEMKGSSSVENEMGTAERWHSAIMFLSLLFVGAMLFVRSKQRRLAKVARQD